MNAGEADIWEQVPPDLIPLLSKNKQITVKNNDPLGSMGMIRFNFLHPPFNNEKLRQAGGVVGFGEGGHGYSRGRLRSGRAVAGLGSRIPPPVVPQPGLAGVRSGRGAVARPRHRREHGDVLGHPRRAAFAVAGSARA